MNELKKNKKLITNPDEIAENINKKYCGFQWDLNSQPFTH